MRWRAGHRPIEAIDAVFVVIPAHDEQERIGACLASVLVAIQTLREERSTLEVGLVVVLDRCVDQTAEIARELGVEAVAVSAGGVGAARAAGVAWVGERTATTAAERVLVVNTDADCVVPATWLVEHVELGSGHDLVQGEVYLDPAEMSDRGLATWRERNPAGRGSLHGANLGFRLAAYLRVGGFPAVSEQEDLLLVRAMKADGALAIGGTRVLTSARRDGRVRSGFAGYLRELDAELDDAPPAP